MQRLLYYFDGAKNIPCLVWEQLAAMARGEMVKEEVVKEDEEGVEGIIRFDSRGWVWQLPARKRSRENILKCPILNSFSKKLAGPCLRNWSQTRILYKAWSWNTKVDGSSTFIFFKVDISSKLTLLVYSFWKGLSSFTQLVKVRGGNLVLALPSIQFSWNFYQIISGTKYE